MIEPIIINDFTIAEPAISKNAFKIHYTQHYLNYVKTLNNLISEYGWFTNRSIKDLITIARLKGPVYNNASQVYNHEFFFEQFNGEKTSIQDSKFLDLITKSNLTVQEFKTEIISQSYNLFGNGYIWVYLDEYEELIIDVGSNAENLVRRKKCKPLINIDLWEHSYYLDYQNNKTEYIYNVLNNINYSIVDSRLC